MPPTQPALATLETTPASEDALDGGCGSSFRRTSPMDGMGNLLTLFGPLFGLVVVRHRLKKRR
ncbi:MAG TPA: hypothetical protein DCF78_00430 [Dehalococcoidia bacterium]|nr:hypothetical protein [Dehalococcoidia bacterium]